MRKWYVAILTIFFMLPLWADTNVEALLNNITLRLTAEQWVTTKTALVTVGINASVSDNDLAKTQNHIVDKLNQLASKVDWHIVTFDRSLDQSGLEKVQVSAQARLSETAMAGLRDRTKALSKPGETFTLDNVQFIPSEDEMRNANIILRNNIYQQVKLELDQLNKIYPEQKYYVHQINFVNDLISGSMQPILMQAKINTLAANTALQVGDKLKLSAIVVLSSAPNADVTKIIHN